MAGDGLELSSTAHRVSVGVSPGQSPKPDGASRADGGGVVIPCGTPPQQRRGSCRRHCTPLRAAVLTVLLACIGFLVVDSLYSKHVLTALEDFIVWVAHAGPIGPIVFVLVYFVGTVLFVPGSVLTIGSGFAFAQACGQSAGVVLGSFVVLVGAVAGDTVAFLLGRYALRPLVAEKAAQYRILAAVDKALEKQGFKMVVLLRLSPVIPFNAFNYLMGVTRVGFVPYALGSVGLVPATIGFVYIGSLVSDVKNAVSGDASNECPEVKWTIFALGCAATVAAITLITIYARRELKREVALAKAAAVPGASVRMPAGSVGGNPAAAYSIHVGARREPTSGDSATNPGGSFDDVASCTDVALGRAREAAASASTLCSVDLQPAGVAVDTSARAQP